MKVGIFINSTRKEIGGSHSLIIDFIEKFQNKSSNEFEITAIIILLSKSDYIDELSKNNIKESTE